MILIFAIDVQCDVNEEVFWLAPRDLPPHKRLYLVERRLQHRVRAKNCARALDQTRLFVDSAAAVAQCGTSKFFCRLGLPG